MLSTYSTVLLILHTQNRAILQNECDCLLCKPLPQFMVFWFLNENIGLRKPLPGFSLGKRTATKAPPFLPPTCLLAWDSRLITSFWRWNESTLQASESEMCYCSRNCQLKSNIWNAKDRFKQSEPCDWAVKKTVVPRFHKGPRRKFVFLVLFHFFPPWLYL